MGLAALGLLGCPRREERGNPEPAPPPSGTGPFLLADLDGDRRAELIWTDGPRCGVARWQGKEWETRWQAPLPEAPVALTALKGKAGQPGGAEAVLATSHGLWTLRRVPAAYRLVPTATRVPLKSLVAAPLGREGSEEILALTAGSDAALALFHPRPDGTFQLRWQGFPASWRPWKVMACDADADGRPDVALGVRKRARYHPRLENRPFLYRWNGATLVPLWRGSRLSRPFTDFVLGDWDGDGADELVASERTREGTAALRGYEWTGFGYAGAGDSPAYPALRGLQGEPAGRGRAARVAGIVAGQGREQVILFGLSEGSLRPLWASPLEPHITAFSWGDVDGDGTLEIVAATPRAWRVWKTSASPVEPVSPVEPWKK